MTTFGDLYREKRMGNSKVLFQATYGARVAAIKSVQLL